MLVVHNSPHGLRSFCIIHHVGLDKCRRIVEKLNDDITSALVNKTMLSHVCGHLVNLHWDGLGTYNVEKCKRALVHI